MKQILAADIGATNSRFAHFAGENGGTLRLVDSKWFPTNNISSFAALIGKVAESKFSLQPKDADMVSIGVAGPIEHGVRCAPPYITWGIDLSAAEKDYGIKRFVLINDFVAQAYACRSPVSKDALCIKNGEPDKDGTIAVIGAGSNLGKAILVPLENPNSNEQHFLAIPSEGGHISFPAETERELEFARFVRKEIGDVYLTCNNVVSGKGISFIHHFLTGKKLPPQEVTATFGKGSETLSWAAKFYGRVCRNFALDVLAVGGLYIAGGIAAKVPLLVEHQAFSDEFERSPSHNSLLKKIPIFLMTNEESSLWGAAFCGMLRLEKE